MHQIVLTIRPIFFWSTNVFYLRELWEKKKKEEEDLLFRDLEELKGLQKSKMFGRYKISDIFNKDYTCPYQARTWGPNWRHQKEEVHGASDEQLDKISVSVWAGF